MNNWAIFSILICLFLIGSVCDARRNRRMVGGYNAEIEEFPHLVSFRYLGLHSCGGSIINASHILTAAHCVGGFDPSEMTVHTGTSRSDKPGIVHEIKAIHVHPDWEVSENGGYFNDIAVVTLQKPIVFNKYQDRIKLPTSNVKYNEVAYLAGWGRTNTWNEARSRQLQKLEFKLITIEQCQPLMIHKILPKHICALSKKGTGMCFGDSGGGLKNSRGEVIAISIFLNERKCGDDTPSGFTNVYLYKDFILSAMKK